jgi:hypothetical protein
MHIGQQKAELVSIFGDTVLLLVTNNLPKKYLTSHQTAMVKPSEYKPPFSGSFETQK